MEFRIADTFTSSLARLSGDEQKAVKTTAFDLQLNPANPSMSFHRLDRAKDKSFWSIRVNKDLRLIVHRTENSLLLCYVDHHDKAYDWAERRKLEVHPKTGAAQLVEIRETVQEIFVPVYIQKETTRSETPKKLFASLSNEELSSYGVPGEWLQDVKQATDQSLLQLIDYLPSEAGEALLELATGGKPAFPQPIPASANAFAHPDAQRRFRTMHDAQELERALEFPWDKWSIFLHPSQRQFVEAQFNGPARVSGSAGTGKTIVALHRAVFLAKNYPGERILLSTFSSMLANTLKGKLRRLIGNEPRLAEQIQVSAINDTAIRLYTTNFSKPSLITGKELTPVIQKIAAGTEGLKFSVSYLLSEWEQVVDMWQLKSWEAYRDVKRLGRKTRLSEQQRAMLWSIFQQVNAFLEQNKLLTYARIFDQLTAFFQRERKSPFQHVVIDEAQDLTVYHLKFLVALGNYSPEALFFAGDLGQRIFQQAFSWKTVGIDIKGRSKTLTVNYRTSHQIRQHADNLLGAEIQDVDGNVEERKKTVSLFNGPNPIIRTFTTDSEEYNHVGDWIAEQVKNGTANHEIGVFVRSNKELDRAKRALEKARIPYIVLDDAAETSTDKAAISTMHYAKGLEFKAVAVMACDDEIIPSQERVSAVTDNADLEEVYNTERNLLYVACTRARDYLLVTSVEPASEFLEDLKIDKKIE
jgi:superfamily I DNA/RNA helicase/mRNA-degrading endonuclease RelE of RelBE toxin-antitoxin system